MTDTRQPANRDVMSIVECNEVDSTVRIAPNIQIRLGGKNWSLEMWNMV